MTTARVLSPRSNWKTASGKRADYSVHTMHSTTPWSESQQAAAIVGFTALLLPDSYILT
jgi:hypothetical protein